MAIIEFTHQHKGGLRFSAVFINNKLLPFDDANIGRADLEAGRVYNISWRIMGPKDSSLVVTHLGHGGVIVDSAIRAQDIETPPDGRRSTFSFFQA
jgi:hypothetical protein